MAKKAQSPKQQTAIKLLVWVLILLAVAGLLIVPKFMDNSKLKKDIVVAQSDLKQAQRFHDAYMDLQARYEEQGMMFSHLVLPEESAIGTDVTPEETEALMRGFDEATANLIQTIKECNLSPPEEGFEMLSSSLQDYENQVLVNAEFTGNFTDAWGFFVKLGAISYVMHIQSINMEDRFEAIACRLALRLSVRRGE